MKKIIITLFIILGTAFVLFGQSIPVPQDTLLNGGQLVFSTGDTYQGECTFGCNADKYKCWQMPPSMDTQIAICGNVAPPFTDIAVVITSERRCITYASCQMIGDPIMAPFAMQAYIEADMQICVFWNSNETDSVGAFVKGFTISAPELNVIGDMDTCGTLTTLDPPSVGNSKGVLTSITGVPVGSNPPAGIYLNTYPDEAGKKPRLVRVLR